MPYKDLLSAIAIVSTFVAFIPHIYDIFFGLTRQHIFSWVNWGITTFIVFLAELEAGGGIGAWPIGASGIITLSIATLAYWKRGDIIINGTDWLFFIAALSSLPLWYLTASPLWPIVILTTVDLSGFIPALNKAHVYPTSDSLLFFVFLIARNFLSVFALETLTVATALYPVSLGIACTLSTICWIISRRAAGPIA